MEEKKICKEILKRIKKLNAQQYLKKKIFKRKFENYKKSFMSLKEKAKLLFILLKRFSMSHKFSK